jgi:hypothetical protein
LLKESQVITLKTTQELLRCILSQLSLLLSCSKSSLSLLLVCDSLNLSVASASLAFKPLGHHEHSLPAAFILFLVSAQCVGLVLKNQLAPCMLEGLSNEDLEHWLNLSVKVIELIVSLVQLKSDCGPFRVWNEPGRWLCKNRYLN